MKKSVKKYQPGGLVDSEGNPVRDGSGNPIMTGSFPDEDEITARGRAKNAEMFKSLVNRVTGRGKEAAPAAAPAAAAPVATPKASDGDVSAYDLRTEAAASAPKRVPTRPDQSSSGPKPAVVTKKQLADSGFTNLRDYLNDQKKLTPRDGKAPERKANGSGSASSPQAAEKPKGKTASEYSRDADAMRNLTRQKAAVSTMPSSVYDADTDRMRNQSRKQARFEGSKRMANTPEAQAKRKAMEKGQALERVSPEEYIGPSLGLKTLSKLAKNLATPKVKEYNPKMLPAPKAAAKTDTKALPAPKDKRGMKEKERAQRAEDREKQKNAENYERRGRFTGGRSIDLKKGGSVSSASKRADGIAQRGKTRGRMY